MPFPIELHRSILLAAFAIAVSVFSGCAAPSAATPATPPPTSAQAGDTTIVAIAPAAGSQQTLLDFLGFGQIGSGIAACERQKHAFLARLFPDQANALDQLVGGPPSAAELGSDNPAVATAAQLDQDNAEAQATINALQKLAKAGCGRIPGVEKSILSALDNYNPDVRLAAVEAVNTTAGDKCIPCRTGSCCTPKIREKLQKMAYETNEYGCPLETSAEVRRHARVALCACGPELPVMFPTPDPDLPTEGPSPDQLPAPATGGGSPAPATGSSSPKPASSGSSPSSPAPKPAAPTPAAPQPAAPAPNPPPAPMLPKTAATWTPVEERQTPEIVATTARSTESDPLVTASHSAEAPATNVPAVDPARFEVQWEELTAPLDGFESAEAATTLLESVRDWTALPEDERPAPMMDVSRLEVGTSDWVDPATLPEGALRRFVSRAAVGTVGPILVTPDSRKLVRMIGRRRLAVPNGTGRGGSGPTTIQSSPDDEVAWRAAPGNRSRPLNTSD